jgi:hypothetical protein
MKWFFALNEKGNEFDNYAKMLKVAVSGNRRRINFYQFSNKSLSGLIKAFENRL